ncbi:hypothetical protein HMPREF1860_01778 [Prevotella amnii]|uniref:Uncharacterized protein n=1 Tax=Prevotella amnii TaxID=419005 RepID=A0A134B720_9BACT|nr:hypothetical protein HMPREF1860_01778 [Prevotella amnii]
MGYLKNKKRGIFIYFFLFVSMKNYKYKVFKSWIGLSLQERKAISCRRKNNLWK